MLVIYDQTGEIYLAGTGFKTPEGSLQYQDVEVPEGKVFDRMDVSVEPHKPIFKDIPKSDMEIVKEQIAELQEQNRALLEGARSVL